MEPMTETQFLESIPLYERYTYIRRKIDVWQEREKEVKALCLSDMHKEKMLKRQTDFGTFSIVRKLTYKFTVAVLAARKELQKEVDKELQAVHNKFEPAFSDLEKLEGKEMQDGLAEKIVTESFRYTPKRG